MYSKLHYFFTLLGIVRSNLLSVETVDDNFNAFVQNLILKNYNRSKYIGILHDDTGLRTINLPQLLESLHIPVVLHDLITPVVWCNYSETWIPNSVTASTHDNIIIVEDSQDFHSMLEVAKSIPFFDAKRKVLVIFTKRVGRTESWIREVFSQLWKVYILNVGLVFHDAKVNLFTYIPWTTPHEIYNLTDQGISANIFYDKLKNLRKYPLRILHYISNLKMIAVTENNSTIYLGEDGMMMSTILEHLNATSNIICPNAARQSPCRFLHRNYTIEGLFGADAKNESIPLCSYSLRLPTALKKPSELDVVRFNIDINFDSRPLRFDMDYRVIGSDFQRMDSYCIILPRKIGMLLTSNLLMPLQASMWLGVVMIFMLHTAIYFAIQKVNETNKKGLLYACFILYGIQMNNVTLRPKKLSPAEKAHLLCWVFYCVLISAAYQSVLISSITSPFYPRPPDHIEELKHIDIPIFTGVDVLADMPYAHDEETSDILLEKIVLDIWTGDRILNVENGYLLPKGVAGFVMQKKNLLDKYGKPLFHLMNECTMPLYTTYQMPRGSPFLQIINKITSRMIESGLVPIWDAFAIRYLNSQEPAPARHSEGHVKLTSAHLRDTFYILFIGHILATGAFFFEIYRKRIRSLM